MSILIFIIQNTQHIINKESRIETKTARRNDISNTSSWDNPISPSKKASHRQYIYTHPPIRASTYPFKSSLHFIIDSLKRRHLSALLYITTRSSTAAKDRDVAFRIISSTQALRCSAAHTSSLSLSLLLLVQLSPVSLSLSPDFLPRSSREVPADREQTSSSSSQGRRQKKKKKKKPPKECRRVYIAIRSRSRASVNARAPRTMHN